MDRRILLLITDLEIGGTPAVVRELAVRLRAATGAHVEVAGLSQSGPLLEQLVSRRIHCTALGARAASDLRIVPQLQSLLRRQRIDTVVSFLIHANALAAVLCPFFPQVRFFQSIQTTQAHPSWHWSLQRMIQHAARRIIVPSLSVARVAQRLSGICPAKIAVIANAIEPGEFEIGSGIDLRHGRAAHATLNIGFIGRLDPVKRIPDLLRALALLPPEIHLQIYGEGRQRLEIEREIARLGLASRVTLHGAIARPHNALKQIDLLVLPSEAEGFGLVLIEAMAAGVPIVATNVAGIRDVVIDGQTGLLVLPRSPKQIAAAITRMIQDSDLRARLTENATADVRRRFTWDVVLPQYLRLFQL